jgi:hypothetical protein
MSAPLALLLLAFAVGTAMGHSAGKLTGPSVSPTVAVVGTTVSFSVTFTDPAGAAPRSVSVAIYRDPKPMTGAGSDFDGGVRFTATATPPVGHYEIWFRSEDADRHLDYVRGPDLTIEPVASPSPTRAPTIATVCAGTAAWAAFAFLGKRRRDDDESDDGTLAAAAATGLEADAAGGLKVDESLLPRWRRPSLQQVRRTDPLRATAETPHLSFESAGVRPLEDYETRRIGYRLVRLLDSPDELRSTEIGILDQGDEVQLLERHGAYWLVLCPDGRQGWVHRMTLADPPRATEPEYEPEPVPQDGMVEYEMPDIEAYAEPPSSDGLLEAYMTARRDVLRTMGSGESGAAEANGEGPTFAAFEAATFAVPAAELEATPTPAPEPASAATPAEPPAEIPDAKPERAGARYSARKTAGTRKAATASRPGTKSRRPSR